MKLRGCFGCINLLVIDPVFTDLLMAEITASISSVPSYFLGSK
jgi:hypothetical protein